MRSILLTATMLLAAIPALAQEAGWIGITIEDQRDRGAVIRTIQPNSPAEKAGLRQGDVVVEFDTVRVVGVQQLTRIVRETPVGRTVDVKVRRDNREETVKITTENASNQPFGRFEINMPDMHVLADRIVRAVPRVQVSTVFVQDGIRAEQLTDQLRTFFGVSGGNGVLITSVDSGSAAAKAGLKAGDVVITVDGRSISTVSEFSREMRANSRPMLKIVRDKKEQEIRIE